MPPAKTAPTLLKGKRLRRMTSLTSRAAKKDSRIIAEVSLRPQGGGDTVLGPSSTEKDRSIFTGRTTGSCLDHVALLQRPLHPVLLAHARARLTTALGTRYQKGTEVIKKIVEDRCLKRCFTMEAKEPSFMGPLFVVQS